MLSSDLLDPSVAVIQVLMPRCFASNRSDLFALQIDFSYWQGSLAASWFNKETA